MVSIQQLQSIIEAYISQMQRVEFIQSKNRSKDAQAIQQEWANFSSLETLYVPQEKSILSK